MTTKREKILKLFESKDWIESPSGYKVKVITYDDFRSIGLSSTIEYQEKYCDPIYAGQILRKMGYRVLFGMDMNVYKK